jgi:5-carboxymethyl-2-hydroxymuconate isomerase
MRLASVMQDGTWIDVVVREGRYLTLETPDTRLNSVRGVAAAAPEGTRRVAAWVDAQPLEAWRSLDAVDQIGPPIKPGAIYTIGQNYRSPGAAAGDRPPRPLVYGKAPTSVTGHGSAVTWDRTLTANVDAECELGMVIGPGASVFGYTIVNDISSRDPWLDGDQWLLGKSMDGFCPVGPWIVTADELTPEPLRLGCTINGEPIQDGTTADMWFSVAEVVAFLCRHVTLTPGDLIATGTPPRLDGPIGPDRHLQAEDDVAAWIEGIGELRTTIR